MTPSGDPVRDAEREHFDRLWGRSTSTLRRDDESTFRDSITPAYERGGTRGGLTQLRAFRLLEREGVAGKDLLDYACGLGKWSIRLAQLGARVSGFDLSEVAIRHARARASFNGLDVRFDAADAARLPYRSRSFDVVVGIGALHHVVKYADTAEELARVMRPGALAVFTEVLGHNPLIELARRVTMRGEEDAGDVILTQELIESWAAPFAELEVLPESLLFMAKRAIPDRHRILRVLHALDGALFAVAPGLRRYCGECVIVLRR